MNSRIPNPNLRIQNLVTLGRRSAALLAKKPAVADLAPKLAEANERLVRAFEARQEAEAARFDARQDRDLAQDTLATAVRMAQHALLLQCEGDREHPAYRTLFPKGQPPLLQGATGKRWAALTDLAAQLRTDPAHADLAQRFDEALAAWKAAVDAHAVARGAEARTTLELDQARSEWIADYTVARAQTIARLRSVKAAKAFFPYAVHKADDGTEPGTAPTQAAGGSATPAAGSKAGDGTAAVPVPPAKGNGTPEPAASPPGSASPPSPAQDPGVA